VHCAACIIIYRNCSLHAPSHIATMRWSSMIIEVVNMCHSVLLYITRRWIIFSAFSLVSTAIYLVGFLRQISRKQTIVYRVWCFVQLALFCSVSDDLTYKLATPTFHHWHTGSCSYGLTFQIPSEADAFAKAVDRSVEAIRLKCPPPDGMTV